MKSFSRSNKKSETFDSSGAEQDFSNLKIQLRGVQGDWGARLIRLILMPTHFLASVLRSSVQLGELGGGLEINPRSTTTLDRSNREKESKTIVKLNWMESSSVGWSASLPTPILVSVFFSLKTAAAGTPVGCKTRCTPYTFPPPWPARCERCCRWSGTSGPCWRQTQCSGLTRHWNQNSNYILVWRELKLIWKFGFKIKKVSNFQLKQNLVPIFYFLKTDCFIKLVLDLTLSRGGLSQLPNRTGGFQTVPARIATCPASAAGMKCTCRVWCESRRTSGSAWCADTARWATAAPKSALSTAACSCTSCSSTAQTRPALPPPQSFSGSLKIAHQV